MSYTGVMVADRYRLDGPIAAGATGEVWRGVDMLLGRPVAVKLLRAEHARHAETLARFRAEPGTPGRCRIRVSPRSTTTVTPARDTRRTW